MDVWIKEREDAANAVFDEKAVNTSARKKGPETSTQEVTLQVQKRKFEKLKRTKVSKWWEVKSLEIYLAVGRVPRGLRVLIALTFENPDPEMLQEWAVNSAESSNNMMRILVKYAKRDREKILDEITIVEKEIG